jgi:hypothetical protein
MLSKSFNQALGTLNPLLDNSFYDHRTNTTKRKLKSLKGKSHDLK